ncbi:MAG: DUF401 family protein [Candidatus Altiarchaeota archaeon]
MIELLKIIGILLAAVLMVNRKVNVALVLFACAALTGLLFKASAYDLLAALLDTLKSWRTLNLIGIVVLMTLLGNLLKHLENLRRIITALENLLDDARIIVAAIPAFIGLMPMPGGAMMSAPFIREAGRSLKLSPEQNTLINYWFRHVWEYAFPLYPALILMSVILDVPIRKISIMMVPFTLLAILVGTVFYLLPVRRNSSGRRDTTSSIRELFWDVSPVASVIVLTLVLDIELLVSLIVTLAVYIIAARAPFDTVRKSFTESKPAQLFILIFSVMYFQTVIDLTGSVEALPETFKALGIPLLLIVFAVPYIAGLMTGYTVGAVGITFPLISFALTGSGVNYGFIMFAYLGGFLGVLSSPVHLCLVLSKDYFEADLGAVYRKLLPAVVLMALTGVAFLLLGIV